MPWQTADLTASTPRVPKTELELGSTTPSVAGEARRTRWWADGYYPTGRSGPPRPVNGAVAPLDLPGLFSAPAPTPAPAPRSTRGIVQRGTARRGQRGCWPRGGGRKAPATAVPSAATPTGAWGSRALFILNKCRSPRPGASARLISVSYAKSPLQPASCQS